MGRPFIDLTGHRYGMMTVVAHAGIAKAGKNSMWECRCDCGETNIVKGSDLRGGVTVSCGCYRRHLSSVRLSRQNRRHGLARSKEYKAWENMIQRCTNPLIRNYRHYGGRGIRVCSEWMGDGGFKRFIDHIGLAPDARLTLDRINNNGHYEPGNVRWATRSDQNRNKRAKKIPA